jgi:N-formylglutamate amidohydrolase
MSLGSTATKFEPVDERAPFEIIESPTLARSAFIFASPHSGQDYRPEFLAASRLELAVLRRSEDCFVDELFAAAPRHGAALLRALFPRAFIDPNREAYELDPMMFDGPLPSHANITSPRVAGGLGTIAKVVADGQEIYRSRLNYAEVEQRIEALYKPYHGALARLIDEALARHRIAILIDCHSMPSIGGPMDQDRGRPRSDIILGDRYGTACGGNLVRIVRQALEAKGYRVSMNNPYAGGFCTTHYGRPSGGVQALQIEVNRALYMNETQFQKTAGFARVQHDLGALIEMLHAIPTSELNRG